jgi:uncharacterized surface protein with fasciclin (FAS1) repeats
MKTTFILALAATLAGGAILAPTAGGAPEIKRPQESRSLIDALEAEPSLGTFTRLIRLSGMDDALRKTGPYTVLAPNDAAFRTLPEADMDRLLDPENRDLLAQKLNYHIIPGRIDLANVSTEYYVTLQGSRVVLHREGNTVWVGRAEVMKGGIEIADGGVIHTINMVLEPDQE